MIKRFFLFAFLIIILSGCSSQKDYEELVFSSWGSVTEVQILKNLIKKFETENPRIKINFMHIPQNYFQKIHLLFASNTAPDVLFMNNLQLPIYESKLEDLYGFVDESKYYPQAIAGMSYKGALKGVPRDISTLVLYVNLDKISLPNRDWSLNDLLKLAQGISDKTTFGISYEDEIYWATPYLTYFGGGILDDNLKPIIESLESKKGLDYYKDLVYKYNVAPTPSQVGSSTQAQMFIDGKLAMYLSGRWMYPKINEKASFRWAVVNFPYGKTPQYSDVSGWVISKDSKHKDAAKKFVEFISSEESSNYFTNTGLVVPARIDASKILNNESHNEKVFLEVIEQTNNTPVNKEYSKLVDKINMEKFLPDKIQK